MDHWTSATPVCLMQPQQHVGKVYNPFSVNILKSGTASLKDGATISITSSCRSFWLGVFWGVKIADVYPIVHAPWTFYQDQPSFKTSLREISLHDEQLTFVEPVERRSVVLKAPPDLDLGPPPRARFPLVVFIVDNDAVDAPWSEVRSLQQIVCLVSMVHLKDNLCPSESHIFSQLVRCPVGKPCDLKQLYISGLEAEEEVNRPDRSSSSAGGVDDACRSSAGASETPPLCSVCQSEPVEQAILPCRHACVCTTCCNRLLNCPICRGFIINTFPLGDTDVYEVHTP